MPVAVALLTLVSTSIGGLFALRYRDRLHLILGFSAGVILGVVAFDLLPEVFDLVHHTGSSVKVPMIALVVGFLAFHIIEKSLLLHSAHEDEYGEHLHLGDAHPSVGVVSALALCAHSFTDGLGIGLAFQLGEGVGVAVALAVIAHDFADGLNTVTLALTHGNPRRRALGLLAIDALAPVAGAAVTMIGRVPHTVILVSLGAFAGFLLYLAAADILPEAHAHHPSRVTLGCTIAGAAVMYAVVGLLPS